MERRYKALILNDYEDAPYAEWISTGEKTIETRMNRLFTYRGDLVICCGKTHSYSANAGKALCIVDFWKGRAMRIADEEAAGVTWHPKRKSLLLRNWRHFSRNFDFAPQRVAGAWQGIFEIIIPEDVLIINRPDILPYQENE